jgi:hypothetical protein
LCRRSGSELLLGLGLLLQLLQQEPQGHELLKQVLGGRVLEAQLVPPCWLVQVIACCCLLHD